MAFSVYVEALVSDGRIVDLPIINHGQSEPRERLAGKIGFHAAKATNEESAWNRGRRQRKMERET